MNHTSHWNHTGDLKSKSLFYIYQWVFPNEINKCLKHANLNIEYYQRKISTDK
jgi:hypothetical protein